MSSSGLTAQPLQSEGAFNWVYLTDWIVNGVLTLFFLFYFNRLFATLLLYLVRLYVWRVLHIYIDLQAIQISPLAGRIFFKGVRYHGDNETIFVHGGHLTWRYWLTAVKQCKAFDIDSTAPLHEPLHAEKADSSSSDAPTNDQNKAAKPKPPSKPCRISVKVHGVEAFLYNRGPAYDWILETVRKAEANRKTSTAAQQADLATAAEKESYVDPRRDNPTSSSSSAESISDKFKQNENSDKLRTTTSKRSSQYGDRSLRGELPSPQLPAFLRLLPIRVECSTGAAVLGNENSKAIITAKFDSAAGEFDASTSGPLDVFKILMDFQVDHPFIQLKPNVDYKIPQLAEAHAIKTHDETVDSSKGRGRSTISAWLHSFTKLRWSNMSLPISIWPRSSTVSIATLGHGGKKYQQLPFVAQNGQANARWLGLTRYLNDDQNDEHNEWASVEYAKSSVLADIDKVDFGFYWDIGGPVPPRPSSASNEQLDPVNEINGSAPPEYGMNLVVHGGHVNYGPWTDRHRLILQQLFFPFSYADAVPTAPLKPGETRLCTVFKLDLRVEGDLVLRIPFREPSKDAKWKGRATAVTGRDKQNQNYDKRKGKYKRRSRSRKTRNLAQTTDVRPFAWFDLKVSRGTAINYVMDMFPTRIGYGAELTAAFQSVDIYSSLNHALLWRCPTITMSCDLSHPLSWNGLRNWVFNINIEGLDFFLLRDHTFLLVDMIEDWTSGQIQDYYTFAPYRYQLNVHFQDYKLYLNTNDANIVDNADDIDENEFIILYGHTLDASLMIPLDRLQPAENAISFNVNSTKLGFELCMPPKSTLKELVSQKDVAQLESVDVVGAYTYCSEVKPGLTETLHLDITGKHLNIDFFGFLGRHFAKIKENYFGDSVHFRTLDEFQDLARRNFEGADSEHPPVKANDLDVLLDIRAEDVNIVLPSGLYNAEEGVRIRVDSADCDLRVNNYYLELMVNSSPLELSCTALSPPTAGKVVLETTETQLFIDGVKVFGHRLFGLPPSEPPYVSNWDVEAGSIVGECVVPFIEKLVTAAESFALGIVDAENAVPLPHFMPIHDSTFVRFACPEIRIWCRMEQAALLLSTGQVGGSFHDLAGKLFSQQLSMVVPNLTLACIDTEEYVRHRNQRNRIATTNAYFRTTVFMSMVQRNFEFKKQKYLQQDHIRANDTRRDNRASCLLQPTDLSGPTTQDDTGSVNDILSLDLPHLPPPIVSNAISQNDPFERTCASRVRDSIARSPLEGCIGGSAGNNRQPLFASLNSHTISFPSPFKAPYFPLLDVEPDLSNVPVTSKTSKKSHQTHKSTAVVDDDVFDDSFDEDTVHMCFMIHTDPSVTVYCTPEAIRSVAGIVQQIQPKYPEQILDQYQFSTITEVLSSYARKRGNNSLVDLSIKVPSLHLRVHNHYTPAMQRDSANLDRYNIIAHDLNVSVRLKNVPTRKNEVDANCVHATLDSLQVIAQKGNQDITKEDSVFSLTVSDILVWLVDSDRISVHGSFYKAETVMTSKNVEYLAALIHRTTLLVDEFRARFGEIFETNRRRLKYLIFKLVEFGSQGSDPSFLTRPSYVIRSSPDHIRNSDSWRIISRLQFIYACLPGSERNLLRSSCFANYQDLPPDAESVVLATFDMWLSFVAGLVKESFAVRVLYSSLADVEKLHDRSKTPIGVSWRSASLKLIVDPGKEQTEFSLDQLSLGLTITPAPPPSALQIFKDYNPMKATVVQVKLGNYSLHVNWSLCELVDHILELFEHEGPVGSDVVPNQKETEARPGVEQEEFHVVFSADSGLIHVEAVNASLALSSFAPKVSITGFTGAAASKEISINILVATSETTLEVLGLQRMLLKTDITTPSLLVEYQQFSESQNTQQTLAIAGDSTEITFTLKEEILGIIEVADHVVRHEVDYIHKLVQRHGKDQSSARHLPPRSDNQDSSALRLSLTLFLNDYLIETALFNDIVYCLDGRNIRLAISPDRSESPKYRIDYDLKAHSHKLKCPNEGNSFPNPTLDMPPINGTMHVQILPQSVLMSGLLTIEKVLLDGTAMYGVLSVLSPSRIQSAIDALQADGETLKNTIEQIFPPSTKTASQISTPQKALLFSAGLVFAGLAISADAPATAREQRPSNILFDVKTVHMRALNYSKNKQMRLNFPEIRAAIQEISLELRHMERGHALRSCGKLSLSTRFSSTVDPQPNKETRKFNLSVSGPAIEVNAETAPLFVEVISHLQDRMTGLDLSRERKYLKRLRHFERKNSLLSKRSADVLATEVIKEGPEVEAARIETSFSFELTSIRISYIIDNSLFKPMASVPEDLVLTLNSVRLLARNQADAQMHIERLQLALVPHDWKSKQRPINSALMPEVIFNVSLKSTTQDRRLMFKAAGKALDLQFDPGLVLPASDLERSITLTGQNTSAAAANLRLAPTSGGFDKQKLFGNKHLASLVIDVDFAGAVVRLQNSFGDATRSKSTKSRSHHGRYGQFLSADSRNAATLRAPGIALKVRHDDSGQKEPTLSIEMKVDASSNIVQPTVVPLILEISDNLKKVVREREVKDSMSDKSEEKPAAQGFLVDESIVQTDPRAILGRTKLNLGMRICRQEFSLTCQPIAKIDAFAMLEDIYITVNDVDSEETGPFFAASATFKGLKTSLKHVYSRDTTFGFDIESIVLSVMNNKHISGTSGVSAILNINPTITQINAKQLQDILLFREIWLPPEIRADSTQRQAAMENEPQDYFVQRYQQVAAATAFPWNATVAVEELKVEVDLGQSIGKTSFKIVKLWAQSKKTTKSRQNLCVGIDEASISSSGRMSGFIELEKVKVRTSIAWPFGHDIVHTPLIQGSVGFDHLKVKAAFDYQAFAVADVSSFEFIMYNVRDPSQKNGDRLVAILDGEKVNAYCISASAALGLSLVQAFERLVQEKQASYDQALKDIEKFLRRRSTVYSTRVASSKPQVAYLERREKSEKNPLSLHTDVVVTLRSLDVGAFPNTLLDGQVLKGEASDIQARFAVVLEHGKVHSGLGLTLGQLRVALAAIRYPSVPRALGEITADDVVQNATSAKGGVILRVPRVVATMQTWQSQDSNVIDYIFKSSFEGKIDVGWNYSRISFIRGMWRTHARNYAARLGKPLPEPALRITGAPKALPERETMPLEAIINDEGGGTPSLDPAVNELGQATQEQPKITAEVNLPQSKYVYRAREPPILETPQLRDLGEATPPLEWVGLHRDRLPNLTHQIVIVTLLEIAKEVEDAYSRILGSA